MLVLTVLPGAAHYDSDREIRDRRLSF